MAPMSAEEFNKVASKLSHYDQLNLTVALGILVGANSLKSDQLKDVVIVGIELAGAGYICSTLEGLLKEEALRAATTITVLEYHRRISKLLDRFHNLTDMIEEPKE